MAIFLPQYVKNCILTLENAGYEAFCVGGAVRDPLIGEVVPHDFDVTTNCPPTRVTELFPHTVPTGIKHGTVTVLTDVAPIEVTTYRVEEGYSDSRHPDRVDFVGNIKDDLSRRDFTVNAIAYNERVGIFDPFDGVGDIKRKTIRTVGDPDRRFCEDSLRIMRAFRFSSQLGFVIEDATRVSAQKNANTLEFISVERVFSELCRLLCGTHVQNASPLFECGGLSPFGIGKCDISAISRLPNVLSIRFAALCILSGSDCETVCEKLKSDNKLKNTTSSLCRLFYSGFPKCRADIKRRMCAEGCESFSQYLSLARVMCDDFCETVCSEFEDILAKKEPYRISELLIGGRDLITAGYKGEEIGQKLSQLLSLVIEDPKLNDRQRLKALITK